MGKTVNRQELAETFGYSLPTITTWIDAGCPVVSHGGRGRQFEFDTAEVHKWLIAREKKLSQKDTAKSVGIEDAGSVLTIDKAKLRYEIARAKTAELDLAKNMEMLAPVEMVAKVVSNEIANARARLLAVANKLRPTIQIHTATAEDAKTLVNEVDKAIYDALKEIKTYGATEDTDSELEQ